MKANFARPPLTEDDWNFSADRLPDRELVACLLWEFLRESPTAQKLARGWAAFFEAKDGTRDHSPLWARMKELRFNLNHKLDIPGFITRAVVQASGFMKLSNTPWQRLPPKIQQLLAEPCESVNKPVFIGFEMHARQLADAVRELTRKELDKKPNGGVLSLPLARASMRFFTSSPAWEALCIVVDWGRYDDNSIRDSFSRLAKEIIKTRPKATKPQVRKSSGLGRPEELRGKLNSLGRTRLYCHYRGVGHLKGANPMAHKWIVSLLRDKSDRAALKALSDAKGRFVRAFHVTLPFEKGRPPLCVANSRRELSR